MDLPSIDFLESFFGEWVKKKKNIFNFISNNVLLTYKYYKFDWKM